MPLDHRNEAVLEFMRTRRSVPAKSMAGSEGGPTPEELLAMAEIAARVPDHGKIAPWRFVEFSRQAKERLNAKVLERALKLDPDLDADKHAIEAGRFTRAASVIMLVSCPQDHPKVPRWEQELSAGAVGMNWLIAANAFGYDAQWLTEWIAFDEMLAADFGLGEGERIAGFIHIGRRTMPKSERSRPEIGEIYTVME